MIRAAWRRIPVDALAFVAIAAVIFVTHRPFVRHGMCFNDPSWYFHFGNRTLHGAVPYRDYVFQVGPLPIYVDAGFQGIFGAKYLASMYAGLFIKSLRVLVMWMTVRRLAGMWPAALLSVFCAFDSIFAFAHHWSTPYAELFIALAGLFVVLSLRAEGRRELTYLGLAGACVALVMSARQSTAILATVALLGTTTILLLRKQYITRQRYVALWGGYAAGLALFLFALAAIGALGPAIQQMFLDAPEKKGVTGIAAILDAISGGALVIGGDWTWWGGFLFYLLLPLAVVGAVVYLTSRDGEITSGAIAMIAVPAAVLIGLATRDASFELLTDVPRTFLSATTLIAVLWPDRLRTWFGLEPLVAIALGTLPLMSDWALEMSFPGRGWGDAASTVGGVIVLVLASSRIATRGKTVLAGVFAFAAISHVIGSLDSDVNPFAHGAAVDGKLALSIASSHNRILRGVKISTARNESLAWLARQVKPGSTCFIYGNLPVMYDLLGCTNPTAIDTTTADFITAGDAQAAVFALFANPPEYIVAQDKSWMSPPLSLDLADDIDRYGGLNPRASFVMHVGLRALLAQYEHVGMVGDAIGPDLAAESEKQYDIIDATHVWRRKH